MSDADGVADAEEGVVAPLPSIAPLQSVVLPSVASLPSIQPLPALPPPPSPPQQPRTPLRLVSPGDGDRVWIPRDTRPTVGHVRDVLAEHPEFTGVIGFDEYLGETSKRGSTPWSSRRGEWTDVDSANLRCWISDRFHAGVSTDVIEQALMVVSHNSPFSSLCDEIRSFRWDGVQRVDQWLQVYVLATDSKYVREIGRRFLVSAVARAVSPGCKADHVLVLEGPTGARKSSAVEALAGRHHYCDSPIDIRSPFVGAQVKSVWFYELPELGFLRRYDPREVMGFITLKDDTYSPKNVRRKIVQPRTFVLVATTNDHKYLSNQTGNRRIWPVKTGKKIRVDDIERDREQLIAEAVWLYESGFRWHLDEDAEADAREEQESRREIHAWEEPISNWIAQNEDMILRAGYITVAQVLKKALKISAGQWKKNDEMKVAEILTSAFGWRPGGERPEEPLRRRVPGVGRIYPYYPPDDAEAEAASSDAIDEARLDPCPSQPFERLAQFWPEDGQEIRRRSGDVQSCPICPILLPTERERVAGVVPDGPAVTVWPYGYRSPGGQQCPPVPPVGCSRAIRDGTGHPSESCDRDE